MSVVLDAVGNHPTLEGMMPANTTVNWFNVTLPPFSASPNPIQSAIDAAAASTTGGVVYVPAGVYTLPAKLMIPANQSPTPPGSPLRPIALVGDGPDATMIVQPNSIDIIEVLGDETRIQDVTFQGPQPSSNPTSGRGIVIGSAQQTHTINKLYLERVHVQQTYSYSLHLIQGTAQRFTSIFGSYSDCRFSANLHDAAVLIEKFNSAHHFSGCNVEAFADHGVKLVGCEGVQWLAGAIEGPVVATQPYLYANDATDVLLAGVWFEDSPSAAVQWFVFLENGCHDWTMTGCTFRRTNTAVTAAQVVSVGNAQLGACRSVVIISPRAFMHTVMPLAGSQISFGNTSTEAYLVGGTVQQAGTLLPIRVQDGTNRSMLFGGASRMRLPRMTTAERDALSDKLRGDTIYNLTANKAEMWDGSLWRGLW